MSLPAHRIAFGARVRELRMQRGMSQEDFAHVAELDRTYVSGVERGRRNPTLDVIQKLATALDVEAALLFRRGAPAPDREGVRPTTR